MPVQTTYLDYASATAGVPFAGLRADNDKGSIGVKPMMNADAVSIPLGAVVARYNTPGPASAKLPAGSSDVLAGIVLHSNAYSNAPGGDLDSTGLVPGAMLNVLRTGRIWAQTMQAVVPGDRLFVSYAVNAPFTAKGQCGNATVASTTIDATTKGEWQTAASALGVAILEVDFVNK